MARYVKLVFDLFQTRKLNLTILSPFLREELPQPITCGFYVPIVISKREIRLKSFSQLIQLIIFTKFRNKNERRKKHNKQLNADDPKSTRERYVLH